MTGLLQTLVLTAFSAKPQPRPGDWSFGWSSVGAIAAVAIAIIVTYWLTINYLKARQQRERNSPWRLFFELCAAHQLTRRQRQLLHRVARQYPIAQPAMLFVEPDWLEADKLGPSWSSHMPELKVLRSRIFSRR